jgi:hypothetical protein
MKNLHPRIMYTPPRVGVQRGVTPSGGPRGNQAPNGGSGDNVPQWGFEGEAPEGNFSF